MKSGEKRYAIEKSASALRQVVDFIRELNYRKVSRSGTRRGTPFAAQTAAANAIRAVVDQGMQRAEVMIKGPGLGRDAALRAIRRSGFPASRFAPKGSSLLRKVRPGSEFSAHHPIVLIFSFAGFKVIHGFPFLNNNSI
ncbi:hypothetical protein E3N88_03823 [Mikania micrantha]|uniref:Ribosomal protein S11 n=1 Tax=Mikania micrantha TaxID=192012 RepID=A0A5N6PSK4_9ASTR|nr:hypothetical protein E3N88_03823 [Mikania micrantha]